LRATPKAPLVEAFRKNAVDPLSAIERIREAFRAAGRVGSLETVLATGQSAAVSIPRAAGEAWVWGCVSGVQEHRYMDDEQLWIP
jgi:hypothetical protein